MDPLARISDLLDDAGSAAVGTSMRIPAALREAATIAVAELGVAPSTTALASDALRNRLEALVVETALDAHYADHPDARPSLAELALAAAEMDGHPMAATPDLIRRAAETIVATHPQAGPDEVLLWAEAQAAPAA